MGRYTGSSSKTVVVCSTLCNAFWGQTQLFRPLAHSPYWHHMTRVWPSVGSFTRLTPRDVFGYPLAHSPDWHHIIRKISDNWKKYITKHVALFQPCGPYLAETSAFLRLRSLILVLTLYVKTGNCWLSAPAQNVLHIWSCVTFLPTNNATVICVDVIKTVHKNNRHTQMTLWRLSRELWLVLKKTCVFNMFTTVRHLRVVGHHYQHTLCHNML